MQPAIHSDVPRTDCAWPHSRQQHVLQLGVAALADDRKMRDCVVKALRDAPEQIDPGHRPEDFLPNFVESWNDVPAVRLLLSTPSRIKAVADPSVQIYGANFDKLKEIKKRVDPKGRFGGPFM